jgi:hypothetical protein
MSTLDEDTSLIQPFAAAGQSDVQTKRARRVLGQAPESLRSRRYKFVLTVGWEDRPVNLDDLLQVMDRGTANLATLDAVWERAQPMIPTGPSRGSSREYNDLRRSWGSLLPGMPPIDG